MIWLEGRFPPEEKGVPAVARAAKETARREEMYMMTVEENE